MSGMTERTLVALSNKFGSGTTAGNSILASTAGGSSIFDPASHLLTNSVQEIRTGTSTLYGFTFYSDNIAKGFIQIFDAASSGAVSLGSTAPTFVITVPPRGYDTKHFFVGVAFTNGIQAAFTTTATGSTAMTTGLSCAFFYLGGSTFSSGDFVLMETGDGLLMEDSSTFGLEV